jgi:alkylhydroperoxidase/carboxymuconolactone decarboxylase family protein YurZ
MELEEIVIQTVPYTGFPTAINALNALRDIVGTAAKTGGGERAA